MNRDRKILEATVRRLEWQVKAQKYQNDPMLWLEERLGEDPDTIRWTNNKGYENHIFDGSVDPLYNAWNDLTMRKWVGIESATGTGKTYIGSRMVYWFLDCFYNSLVVILGPTSSQLKDNMWSELRTAHPKFKKIRKESIIIENDLRVIDTSDMKSWHAIMRSGAGDSKSDEKASSKLSGFHRGDMLFIFDEMQGIGNSAIEAIENTCTGGNNLIVGFGNPDSKQDSLHKFCTRKGVSHYIVSGLDHPNVVLGNEKIPGAVTRKSIERRKEKYGEDSPFYLSRVRGICPDYSMSDLFDLDKFDICCEEECEIDRSAPALGLDPANSTNGDDACAVFGFNNYCMAIQTFKCPDSSRLADNVILSDEEILNKFGRAYLYDLNKVKDFQIKPHNIGVDNIGVGVGTVNQFLFPYKMKVVGLSGNAAQDKDRVPKDGKKLLYNFGNLRAQMIWQFAYDINNLNISFKNVTNKTALSRMRKAMRYAKLIIVNSKNYITPKEDIKRYISFSPNEFDAAVYWNWIRNNKKKENIGTEIFAVDYV